MDKQEKIVCAAARFEYMIHSEVVMCLDYNDNRVQDHISNDMAYGVIGERTNGFITNHNRFVNPTEAMKIYNEYSTLQLKHPDLRPKDLY